MKHLFNNISESEKKRILEMHQGTKMVFFEQVSPQQSNQKQTEIVYYGTIKIGDTVIWDGKKQPQGSEDVVKTLQGEFQSIKPESRTGILTQDLINILDGVDRNQTQQKQKSIAGDIVISRPVSQQNSNRV